MSDTNLSLNKNSIACVLLDIKLMCWKRYFTYPERLMCGKPVRDQPGSQNLCSSIARHLNETCHVVTFNKTFKDWLHKMTEENLKPMEYSCLA